MGRGPHWKLNLRNILYAHRNDTYLRAIFTARFPTKRTEKPEYVHTINCPSSIRRIYPAYSCCSVTYVHIHKARAEKRPALRPGNFGALAVVGLFTAITKIPIRCTRLLKAHHGFAAGVQKYLSVKFENRSHMWKRDPRIVVVVKA